MRNTYCRSRRLAAKQLFVAVTVKILTVQKRRYTVQMNSMQLTGRQLQILDFIRSQQQETGQTPTVREIASHFRFRSMTAAMDHIRALVRKGVLRHSPGKSRSWQIVSPLEDLRNAVVDIPVYGSIPAGFSEEQNQEAAACISVDVGSIGIIPTAWTFALKVRGDSMVGKHILDGDVAVFDHGVIPRPGDTVAALIDNESTLKTFLVERGKPFVKAENPKYPKLIPATELVIQGVMVALMRKRR
jgi:repressor LexA